MVKETRYGPRQGGPDRRNTPGTYSQCELRRVGMTHTDDERNKAVLSKHRREYPTRLERMGLEE